MIFELSNGSEVICHTHVMRVNQSAKIPIQRMETDIPVLDLEGTKKDALGATQKFLLSDNAASRIPPDTSRLRYNSEEIKKPLDQLMKTCKTFYKFGKFFPRGRTWRGCYFRGLTSYNT